MLQKIIIENFGPIKDKIEFSMIKGKTEQYSENIIQDTNILKTAYIYGSNNSGKSRMLESLKLLIDITHLGKELFYGSERTIYLPNYSSEKKTAENSISKLEYNFIILEKEYKYLLELNFIEKKILKEQFFVDEKEIFSRIDNLIQEKSQLEKDIFAISYFATQSGKYEDVNIFYNYLKNIIFIDQQREFYLGIKNKSRNIEKIEFLENNIKKINDLMPSFGFDFTLNVSEEEIINKGKYITVNKNDIVAPLTLFESFGTNVFIDLLLTIESQEDKTGIIVIDEIERGIHYGLVAKFIKYINEKYPKKQLILATHMTDLLECELQIRKDQVYITEIENYVFSIERTFNKRAIRETMNFQKVLKSGAVGGLPNFRDNKSPEKSW